MPIIKAVIAYSTYYQVKSNGIKYKYDTKEVESKKSKIGVPWMERDMFRGAVSQKSLGTTGLDCHTCTDGSAKRRSLDERSILGVTFALTRAFR